LRDGSLPALAEDCNRLVALVREEFAELRRTLQPAWYRRKDRPAITPATTPVVQAKFGEVLFIDTTDGDVEFYLPSATQADAFRSVAFIKRTSTNGVIARTVPPGLIHESDSLTITSSGGLNVLTWDGVANWWRVRG
jgi:hypothetical protein